jgi:hypothetical protein
MIRKWNKYEWKKAIYGSSMEEWISHWIQRTETPRYITEESIKIIMIYTKKGVVLKPDQIKYGVNTEYRLRFQESR